MNRTWKTALLAHQENVQRCRNFGEGLMLLERYGAPPPFGIYAAHADWPVMVPVKALEEQQQYVGSARVLGAPDMAIRWVRLTMGANQHDFQMALSLTVAQLLGFADLRPFKLNTPEQLKAWAEALRTHGVPHDRLPTDAATFAAYLELPSQQTDVEMTEDAKRDDGGYTQRWPGASALPRPRIRAYDVALRLLKSMVINQTVTPTSFEAYVHSVAGLHTIKFHFSERGAFEGAQFIKDGPSKDPA